MCLTEYIHRKYDTKQSYNQYKGASKQVGIELILHRKDAVNQ